MMAKDGTDNRTSGIEDSKSKHLNHSFEGRDDEKCIHVWFW